VLALMGSAGQARCGGGRERRPRGRHARSVNAWLKRLHEPANFNYLLGTPRPPVPVWNGYYVDEQRPGVEIATHTSEMYLVDARGMLRGAYNAASPIDPHDVAHDFQVLLHERA
jgi:cytochrome oxidase Cu insertion factor (SCO1/SenC/PrrC family)